MKFIVSVLMFLCLSLPAMADTISVHCPQGCPTNPEGSTMVYRHVYALSNNPDTKFANWVAYEVNPSNFGAPTGRAFRSDPDLPREQTLEVSDYKGANATLGTDKGHLAPAGAHSGSHRRQELDYLSNIVPQHQTLNRGIWRDLEDAVTDTVRYDSPLYVIAGPLYSKEMVPLPSADEPHVMPSAFFKVVYDDTGGVAFLMEQDIEGGIPYCSKRVPLSEVSEATVFKWPTLQESTVIATRLGCKSS